jgi:Uma2 family endonuclease
MTTLVILTEAPAVPGPPQGRWTYADWESLPDDGNRYEIIDGMVYMTTAPSSFHQWITGRLWRYVGLPAEDQGLGFAYNAPVGLIMPHCDPVQPDFVVVLREHASIIHDRRIWGVPDLIVEILSPGNTAYDEEIKRNSYDRAGVPECAIVDPRNHTLTHYVRDSSGRYGTPRVYEAAETMSFDCLPTAAFHVGALFDGAPDTTL